MKDNIIVNSICEYLKGKIMSKEMFPGYRIVEDEIANELGVSRTPLRRALTQLQYEGFLEIIPNRGTYVIQSTQQEINWVYEARICIETGLAASIIENATQEDIADLRANYEKQCQLKDNFSIVDYSVLNRDFHLKLTSISQNEYMRKFAEEVYNRIFIFLTYFDNSLNNQNASTVHLRMIEALEKKEYEKFINAIIDDAELGNVDIAKSKGSISHLTKLREAQNGKSETFRRDK